MVSDPRYAGLEAFYAQHRDHEDPGRRVAWRSTWDQEVRFEGLLAAIPAEAEGALLDVGCGLGDLLPYLARRGLNGLAYTGIDLLPEMVEAARRRHPGADFRAVDILSPEAPAGPFDYVLCSGALNVGVGEDHWAWVEQVVDAMWRRTGGALLLNALDDRRLDDHAGASGVTQLGYVEAERLIAKCRGLTRRVVLREDVLPTDLVVWCFKGPSPVVEAWAASGPDPAVIASAHLDHRLPDAALAALEPLPDDDPQVLNLRAVALLQQHRASPAIRRLRQALVLDPGHVQARLNLAAALAMAGDTGAAVTEWRAVLPSIEEPGLRAAIEERIRAASVV
jgi:SAM-dependent methyltransferase